MKIGQIASGVSTVTSIELNYVPQYLYYIAATQLTRITVTVQGDGIIYDSDADGLTGVSGIGRFGAVANSYLIPLADGYVPGKVTTITVVNSAAVAIDLYGFSMGRGQVYVQTFQQQVLQNSKQDFKDFTWLTIAAPGTTDIINITYQDGTVDQVESTELKGMITLFSNDTDSFVIDNTNGWIKTVSYTPVAARTVYVTKIQPVGNIA